MKTQGFMFQVTMVTTNNPGILEYRAQENNILFQLLLPLIQLVIKFILAFMK